MICIRCGRDIKYKDRTNRTCPGCKQQFAFEPRQGDPVTDMLFRKAINAVSSDGSIRWGVEHLYYEVCRRKRGNRAPRVVVFVLVGLTAFVVTLSVLLRSPFVYFLTFVIGVATVAAVASRLKGPFVPIDLETFNRLWSRWRDAHGKPGQLIERAPEQPVPKDLEKDIGDYSFDRAVICDRARTVDLLVANNFHFENNCAILSIDGYPKRPFQTIRKMFKRNPRLQVFVLHDATLPGCRLAHRLVTDPEWFGGSGLRVIDLGLRPRHAGPFRGLLLHGEGVRLNDEDGIRPDEAEWLSKYKLELAAARPEQVLKRLFAGLRAHADDDPRTGSTAGAVTYCGAFDVGGYAGDGEVSAAAGAAGDGGADAFG